MRRGEWFLPGWVLLAGVLLSSCGGHGDSATVYSPVAHPVAANGTGAPRCGVEPLAARWVIYQIGAGAESQWIAVTNASSKPCRVDHDVPSHFVATSSTGSARGFRPRVLNPTQLHLRRVRVLPPHQSAWFEIGYGDPANCGHPHAARFDRIRFMFGTSALSARLQGSPLTLACGGTGVTPLVRPPFAASSGVS